MEEPSTFEADVEEELLDDYERCPVCRRAVCPGAMDVCEHFQAAIWDNDLMWSETEREFCDAWGELSELFYETGDLIWSHERELDAGLEHLEERAVVAARDMEMLYWTDEMDGHSMSTDGPIGGAGMTLYHSNPNRLREIVAELKKAAAWLEVFIDEHGGG